jgi:hypothetical protein
MVAGGIDRTCCALLNRCISSWGGCSLDISNIPKHKVEEMALTYEHNGPLAIQLKRILGFLE